MVIIRRRISDHADLQDPTQVNIREISRAVRGSGGIQNYHAGRAGSRTSQISLVGSGWVKTCPNLTSRV